MQPLIKLMFTVILTLFIFTFPHSALAVNNCNTCSSDCGPCVNPCPPPEKPAFDACPGCCAGMGGIQYCDSSAGRFVCNNGFYSSCYCSRHAVMDLQKIEGCCLWQGGVMTTDLQTGLVICNNGNVSEICTEAAIMERSSRW